MNWKINKLRNMIELAFDLIPEDQHEDFVNSMIKIVFEYIGDIKE